MEERITAKDIGSIPLLDDRQRQEALLAIEYVKNYNHGTDGHNRLLLIDKLVRGYLRVLSQLNDTQSELAGCKIITNKMTDVEITNILERYK